MSANEKQIGGNHYQVGKVQHWDLFGSEYLIGNATKYLRYAKKGGIQDLEKAKHYCEKLIELFENQSIHPNNVDAWAKDAGLNFVAHMVARSLYVAEGADDVRLAMQGIDELIAEERLKKFAENIEIRVESYGGGGGGDSSEPVVRVDMTERRVPKYDKTWVDPRYAPPEEGAQHASLYPWQVSRERVVQMGADSAVRHAATQAFYKWHTRDLFRLEPVVENPTLLTELQACYTSVAGTGKWLLRIERMPEELREEYPRLQREMNAIEYLQSSMCYRFMYVEDNAGKWCLNNKYDAWGR